MSHHRSAEMKSIIAEREAIHIHDILLQVRRHCERNVGKLEPEELERLADLLLRIAEPDAEYPCRHELDNVTQKIVSLDDPYGPARIEAELRAAPSEITAPSLQALIARIIIAADLPTRKQREVARLHLWGYSLSEVAAILHLPESTVAGRWRSARQRLQQALQDWPLDEMLDLPIAAEFTREQIRRVHLSDCARRCYQPPQHCPEGREKCATTGVCHFRGATAT
jgi:hypothetical protein